MSTSNSSKRQKEEPRRIKESEFTSVPRGVWALKKESERFDNVGMVVKKEVMEEAKQSGKRLPTTRELEKSEAAYHV